MFLNSWAYAELSVLIDRRIYLTLSCDKMFKTRFNECIRIGDYCDHVVFARRIFLSYTLRQGGLGLLTLTYNQYEPYRNMMGCCLVQGRRADPGYVKRGGRDPKGGGAGG